MTMFIMVTRTKANEDVDISIPRKAEFQRIRNHESGVWVNDLTAWTKKDKSYIASTFADLPTDIRNRIAELAFSWESCDSVRPWRREGLYALFIRMTEWRGHGSLIQRQSEIPILSAMNGMHAGSWSDFSVLFNRYDKELLDMWDSDQWRQMRLQNDAEMEESERSPLFTFSWLGDPVIRAIQIAARGKGRECMVWPLARILIQSQWVAHRINGVPATSAILCVESWVRHLLEIPGGAWRFFDGTIQLLRQITDAVDATKVHVLLKTRIMTLEPASINAVPRLENCSDDVPCFMLSLGIPSEEQTFGVLHTGTSKDAREGFFEAMELRFERWLHGEMDSPPSSKCTSVASDSEEESDSDSEQSDA